MNTNPEPSFGHPKRWQYLLGAGVMFVVLVPLWTMFDVRILEPDSLTQAEIPMQKLFLWFGVPALAVGLAFGGQWLALAHEAEVRQEQFKEQVARARKVQAEARTEQGRREYVLEIIGLGVTLDKYRQGKLWDALQAGAPQKSIREQDPKKYPWTSLNKAQTSGSRGGDALENGALHSPDCWGVPVFNAEPPNLDPNEADSPIRPSIGLAGGADMSDMSTHLFVAGSRHRTEHPDRILEDVFNFFDANPDIPFVVLNSDDSMTSRDSYSAPGTPPLLKDGYYIPEMPDAATLFLLARRERVDAIRPFAFDDVSYDKGVDYINRYGVGRRLFLAYLDLRKAVPSKAKLENPKYAVGRTPMIAEWLPAAAKFAARPDIRGLGETGFIDRELNRAHRPPMDWKPTPWFPVPWSKEQLADFDNLPTLGFLHRPVFVKMTDEHGKPLARRDQRQQALAAGWQEALRTLPEEQRGHGPARVIAASGGNVDQMLALERVLHDYGASGGPELDTGKTKHFINTDRRLGNTGATTLFMQMAIGVMGSYRAGGPSAAVNLRDPSEASIVLITPPSEATRKLQTEQRGDVFHHRNAPAIDPANYAPPGNTAQ